jgi:glutaconate CoA-transferase, subunit A
MTAQLEAGISTGATSKVVPLAEAAALIPDGGLLGFQTPAVDLLPMALLRERMRQGLSRVSLVGVPSGSFNFDLLIGAGLVEQVQICNLDLGGYGAAPNFKRQAEDGRLKILDST